MATVIFTLNGMETKIQCKTKDKMKDIIDKFKIKAQSDFKEAHFLYGGKQVNFNLTFLEQANSMDKKRKEMNVLVYTNNETKDNNEGLVKSKEVICPECKENCLIDINNYKIKFYFCKNRHIIDNISLKDFKNNKNIDENKIKCNNCNNTKYNSYNKQFYKCLKCKINLCPLCNQQHNKTNKDHVIIDYDNKNYICFNHNDFYISYCSYCKMNLCMKCEMKHDKKHEIINFKNIFTDEDELKKDLTKFKEKLNTFNKRIKELIDILNNVSENMNNYYNIIYDILYNYNIRQRNYEVLKNIDSIKKFIQLKDINDLINENNNNYIKKFDIIYDIYKKINSDCINEQVDYQTNNNNNDYNINNNNKNIIHKNIPPPPPLSSNIPIVPIKKVEKKQMKIENNKTKKPLTMEEEIANFKFNKKSEIKKGDNSKTKKPLTMEEEIANFKFKKKPETKKEDNSKNNFLVNELSKAIRIRRRKVLNGEMAEESEDSEDFDDWD